MRKINFAGEYHTVFPFGWRESSLVIEGKRELRATSLLPTLRLWATSMCWGSRARGFLARINPKSDS